MSHFSNWLRSAIDGDPNMDQAEVARRIDVSASSVSRWLRDEEKPSLKLALKLCLLFKVSPEYLMPLIEPEDVINMTPPDEQEQKRAELLARLPMLARLLDRILALPVDKQSFYVDLLIRFLPGLDRPRPEAK